MQAADMESIKNSNGHNSDICALCPLDGLCTLASMYTWLF